MGHSKNPVMELLTTSRSPWIHKRQLTIPIINALPPRINSCWKRAKVPLKYFSRRDTVMCPRSHVTKGNAEKNDDGETEFHDLKAPRKRFGEQEAPGDVNDRQHHHEEQHHGTDEAKRIPYEKIEPSNEATIRFRSGI